METIFENGGGIIKTLDEQQVSFIVNGHRLKLYNKPVTRDEFIQNVLQ